MLRSPTSGSPFDPSMAKTITITEADIALYLGKNPRSTTSKSSIVAKLVDEFSALKIWDALNYKGRRITVAWIIKEILLDYEAADDLGERAKLRDRLMGFIQLGAVQDPDVARTIGNLGAGSERKAPDPGTRRSKKPGVIAKIGG